MDKYFAFFDRLSPLHVSKSEAWAAIIGFAFGGLGLGIYFRSFIDFIIPVAISIALLFWVGDIGWLGGGILASGYGYFRVKNSNERLARPTASREFAASNYQQSPD